MSSPNPHADPENTYPVRQFGKKAAKKKDLTDGFRIPFKKGSVHEAIQNALTNKKK